MQQEASNTGLSASRCFCFIISFVSFDFLFYPLFIYYLSLSKSLEDAGCSVFVRPRLFVQCLPTKNYKIKSKTSLKCQSLRKRNRTNEINPQKTDDKIRPPTDCCSATQEGFGRKKTHKNILLVFFVVLSKEKWQQKNLCGEKLRSSLKEGES